MNMNKINIDQNISNMQLIKTGLELSYSIAELVNCLPDLSTNPHVTRAVNLAKEWNDRFMETYVTR